jgi:hypothetical protein
MGERDKTLYRRVVVIAGVPVKCQPAVRGWGGWPEDVVDTLRRWNSNSKSLSFYGMDYWGGLATGFAKFSEKCTECGDFFNNSGTTACWLKNRWVCDDCIVALARTENTKAA